MATTLGYAPNKANLVLTLGADFICSVMEGGKVVGGQVVPTVVWESGTQCWISIDGITGHWCDAIIDTLTATAKFRVESAQCDSVPDGATYRLYLQRPTTPTTEYCWFLGSVRRKDA